jgi:N-dimethylarginine dimethylaminohydrolase
MIRSCAEVQLVEPDKNCPDMVFTANAGFQFDGNNVVLSRFRHSQRQLEEPLFQQWFEQNGYRVHTVKESFEGQGDMLRDANGRLWLGTGFRTDSRVIDELEVVVNSYVNVLELADPRWYHLDTCFCPLPNGELMWYPGAFSDRSQDLIRNSFDTTIDICEEDALQFVCNSVCIMNNIFVPGQSELVGMMLDKLGYNKKFFDLSEFLKSGGAAKCLVMDLADA